MVASAGRRFQLRRAASSASPRSPSVLPIWPGIHVTLSENVVTLSPTSGLKVLVHYAIHFLCKKWTILDVVLRIQNYHAKKKKKKVSFTPVKLHQDYTNRVIRCHFDRRIEKNPMGIKCHTNTRVAMVHSRFPALVGEDFDTVFPHLVKKTIFRCPDRDPKQQCSRHPCYGDEYLQCHP